MNNITSYLELPNGTEFEVPYHHDNNLPMIFSTESTSSQQALIDFDDLTTESIHLNVADKLNQNLTAAQKE